MTNLQNFTRCFESDLIQMGENKDSYFIKHDDLVNTLREIFSYLGISDIALSREDFYDIEKFKITLLSRLRSCCFSKNFYFVITNREGLFYKNKEDISIFFSIVFDIIYERPNLYFVFVTSDKVKFFNTSIGIFDEYCLESYQKKIIKNSFILIKYIDKKLVENVSISDLIEKSNITFRVSSADSIYDCLSDEEFFLPRPTALLIPKVIQKSEDIVHMSNLINDLRGRRTLPLYLLFVDDISHWIGY